MTYSVIQDLISAKISGEWGVDPVSDNFVKVLRTTNFSNDGKLNLSSVVEREIDEVKVQKKKLQYGDIIIEKSGGSPNQPVGRVVFFDIDDGNTYLCNNFTSILRPSDKVFPRYLFYCLFALHLRKKTLVYQNKTTGIINLQLDRYLTTEKVPVPSFEEQKRIVRELDAADALRQKRKQAIALLDDYLKAVFLEMFGDDLENGPDELRKYLRVIGGGAFKSTDFQDAGIPVIKIGTVNKGFFDLHNCSFLPSDFLQDNKNAKYTISPDDLLISLTGTVGKEDYGNVCFATAEYPQYLLNQRVAKLDFDSNVLTREFLFFFFKNEKIKSQLTGLSRGVRQANISNEDILSLKIAIPSMTKQKKFSDLAKMIASMHLAMTVQVDQMQRNFDSLMQSVFK